MTDTPPILGIDLGTTNSAVAWFGQAGPEIINIDPSELLFGGATMPSVVGLGPDGAVLVGAAARNQAQLAPERTVASAKRHMGEDTRLSMGARTFAPQEISAVLLGALRAKAEASLGRPVGRAVVTVPAFFTDAQRQATREAGVLAGLEVVRILNEPTAAALAYGGQTEEAGWVLVYDLGGGTFDVSIVRVEAGVVEVQVSAGDNRLGGDDIDALMAARLVAHAKSSHGLEELGPVAHARILRAAEEAKIALSTAPFATTHLDHLGEVGGRAVHLDYTWERASFVELIEPLIERTMGLVDKSLRDASLQAGALNRVLLVGGSTRIPAVRAQLAQRLRCEPEGAVDPDLCVALGAASQAGMEMGLAPRGVLVDVTPYTFGTSALDIVNGVVQPRHFVPIISRNTKLPARRSEVFFKHDDAQDTAEVEVFQGEAENADDNTRVGTFTFSNLDRSARAREGGVVFTFSLDQDGVLEVEALERASGKRISGRIDNVLGRKTPAETDRARADLNAALGHQAPFSSDADRATTAEASLPQDIADLLQRTTAALARAAASDAAEMIELAEDLRRAVSEEDSALIDSLKTSLEDILFYVEA